MILSDESQEVFKYIDKYQPIRPNVIVKGMNISEKTVYKHLANLVNAKKVEKKGDKGKIYYSIYLKDEPFNNISGPDDYLVEQNYIYVSPIGEIVRGNKGLQTWAVKNGLDFDKEKALYIKRLSELKKIKKNNMISAKGRILAGEKDLAVDGVFFSDFYTFDHFGKTKLGQLVYVAKNSQNIELIEEISGIIKPSIEYLINKYSIDSVGFIPPTIDRKIQIMDELEKSLYLDIKKLKIEKVSSKTKVAQKTLKKLDDRIFNAKSTISVDPTQKINGNILLVDDATGSGATLNETAKKIKTITNGKFKVFGYTVVGSYKGFDVISEV